MDGTDEFENIKDLMGFFSNLGESEISQVFQKGFKMGDKVVRFAMVQVAN